MRVNLLHGFTINPVGAVGVGVDPEPVPTKLVTLDAGRVAVKLPNETGRLDCCARSNELEVVHGVTLLTVSPFKVNVSGVSDPFWLIATMTMPPVVALLYAVTETPDGAPVVPTTTKPGRTNLLKLPRV